MANAERQERILQCLRERGTVSVHRLSQELYASEATIRRDLSALESRGKVKRTFGGAVPVELLNREVPLILRQQEHPEAKDIIAAKAATLVSDGDTIFLDASSTTFRLVRYLASFRDLTVITNGPRTSLALGALQINSICTGGTLLPNSEAYVGEYTCAFFRRFNPNVVFLSCRGVTGQGVLCDSSLDESHVREAMLSGTGRKVFLCDTSKFGKTYRYNLCHLREMDTVLCEFPHLPEPYARMVRNETSDFHKEGSLCPR